MSTPDIALLVAALAVVAGWHWWKLGWRQAVVTVSLLAAMVLVHRWLSSIWGSAAWLGTMGVLLMYLLFAWRVKRLGPFVLWRERVTK
jgi:hypothetical protein